MKPGLKKILRLFDYFKEAYRVNVNNKSLYRPQIIYALIKTAMLFIMLVFTTFVVEDFLVMSQQEGNYKEVFTSLPFILLIVLSLLIIVGFSIIHSYVEAGLIYMYLRAVAGIPVSMDDFKAGGKKYFTKIFIGNFLISLFWFVALIPYMIVGFITLGIGFSLVPVIISALLMVWKIIVIKEDLNTMDAIKKSIAFGRANLFPASVYIIIINTISGTGGGGGGSNPASMANVFNGSSSNSMDTSTASTITDGTIAVIKWVMIGSSTYISLGVLAFHIVGIIISVFFYLATVILYLDNWSIEEETTNEMEVV